MKDTIKDLLKDIWNVPNVLTMLRLALVPVFAVVLMAGHTMWALGVFCIASLTDALDGFIARKYHLITSFGKLMDPLADKLMVITALICQASRGVLPWAAIIIVAIKELLLITGGGYMLKREIVVQANYLGKVGTVFFITALILSFFHAQLAEWYPLDITLLWVSVVLSLAALVCYTIEGLHKLNPDK